MLYDDPFAAAINAEPQSAIIYGEVLLDVWFCILEKGTGKQAYNSLIHKAAQRRTAIGIAITPLPETGQTFTVERTFIAENAKDGWLVVTKKSLIECGINPNDPARFKALHQQYAKVETVKYGTYDKNGETKDLTAPKFLAVYVTREECLKAWAEETGNEVDSPPPAKNGKVDIDELNDALLGSPKGYGGPANGKTDMARQTALAFLPALIRQCQRPDHSIPLDELRKKLAETPFIKDYFTEVSPEVMSEVQRAIAESPF